MLDNRVDETALLWSPGHHGIAGSEEVNACAKQAATITAMILIKPEIKAEMIKTTK